MKVEIVPPQQRGYLRARDFEVDLTSKLGKTVVVSATTPLSQQGGYLYKKTKKKQIKIIKKRKKKNISLIIIKILL